MKRIILLFIATVILSAGCASIENTVKTPPRLNTEYTSADGTVIRSYIATPSGAGPHPAVLMIHEWWGLNEDITLLADALAAEGFVVLAADAYRGELGTTVAQALSLTRNTPVDRIRDDVDAALDYLISRDDVDPDRIGSTGFCFGGRESMHLGIRSDRLSAVVTLYGSGLVTDAAELGYLGQGKPVLGIFGEDDNSIPLDEVAAFEDALSATGASHTVSVYPEMGHAFVKNSTYQGDGAPAQAWRQMVEFFKEYL